MSINDELLPSLYMRYVGKCKVNPQTYPITFSLNSACNGWRYSKILDVIRTGRREDRVTPKERRSSRRFQMLQ